MVNILWYSFVLIGSFFCIITNKLDLLNEEILGSAKTSLDMVIRIFPVMALWLGIMNIAKGTGLLDRVTKLAAPIFTKLFPEIPKNHESIGFITSNMVANMFGLGNAATPFGLKAMKSLQDLNTKKDKATRSMITFLVLNTSGLTIIPTTVISLRMMHGSINSTDIVFPCIVVTFLSTFAGLLMDRFLASRCKK